MAAREGDEVVVPSFTFYASAEAIPPTGARPVFCDVDPDTMVVTADTVRAALTHPLVIITGGPGTGKTLTVRALLAAASGLPGGCRPVLAAPTGRAARRLSDVTGQPAATLHRLLEASPQEGDGQEAWFRRDEDHPLDGDLLVVDEASMMDVLLGAALFRAVPEGMSAIQAEVYFSRKYRPLEGPPEAWIEPTIAGLTRCGVLRPDDRIVLRQAMLIPWANIIFDLEREAALRTVHGFLAEAGIAWCGRYGDWGYLWSDEAFRSGERAASGILDHAGRGRRAS